MTQVVILCGGLGTRIGLETKFKPKPMILINGKPILWHLMTYYKNQGFNDFILAAGYKNKIIKKYFKNYKKNGKFFQHKIFHYLLMRMKCSIYYYLLLFHLVTHQ